VQIVITAGSELPIYRQVMRQISDAIAGGRLRPGDKLTSQRELAEQLVIAPLTVKKAYDELEREGLIRTERGRGTFVTAMALELDPAEQRERLRDPARQLLSRAHLAGVSFDEVVSLLAEEREELDRERQSRTGPPNDGSGGTDS
jgi:GntR family transcriptional regulator